MKRKMLESAAGEIAAGLFGVERNCDASIEEIAKMALKISSTREPAGLSIFHGQSALDSLAKTLTAVTAARRELCDLHKVLDEENKLLGNPAKSFGDAGKPALLVSGPADLRQVA